MPNPAKEHMVGPKSVLLSCVDQQSYLSSADHSKLELSQVATWGKNKGQDALDRLTSTGWKEVGYCSSSQRRLVLPPGYEEELYCPSEKCLKAKTKITPGPKTSHFDCVNKAGLGSPTQPIAWGKKMSQSLRTKHQDNGMVANQHCQSARRRLDGDTNKPTSETFLCPRDWCGEYVDHGPGFTGPFHIFHTCVETSTRSAGNNRHIDKTKMVDFQPSQSLPEWNDYMARGYHDKKCSEL